MIQNLAITTFILLCILFTVILGAPFEGVIIFLAALALVFIFIVVYWAKTTIVFTSGEAIVESNVFYKKKKNIPYSKIASVNTVRNIFNKIFGTTTLSIHINTSRNPKIPEARFVLNASLAEAIKKDLTTKIFKQKEETYYDEHESVIKFTHAEVILHSFFRMPTLQTSFGFAMIAYSIISAIFFEGSGIVYSLTFVALAQTIPVIMTIMKYINFKIYRIDDQIHIQYGMLQQYEMKFDVGRINAVRIRRPFFARLMGRSCLEAEVVGLTANSKESIPLLCLMSKRTEIERVIRELVPEFIYEPSLDKQPTESKYPLLMKASVGSVLSVIILAYPIYWLYFNADTIGNLTNLEIVILQYILILALILAIVFLFYAAHVSSHVKAFGKGEELFTVINGILDREIITMQYDRVQIFEVGGGQLTTRLGLARGSIYLLASEGSKTIKTGYFSRDSLNEVSDIMLDRLKGGKYSYKKSKL